MLITDKFTKFLSTLTNKELEWKLRHSKYKRNHAVIQSILYQRNQDPKLHLPFRDD